MATTTVEVEDHDSTTLLRTYNLMLKQARREGEQFKLRAKHFVPKLYKLLSRYSHLEKKDWSPHYIRRKIENDCEDLWALSTIRDVLPSEAKDASKRKGGIASGNARENRTSDKESVNYERITLQCFSKNESEPTEFIFEKVVVENGRQKFAIFYKEKDIHLEQGKK